MKQCEKHLSVSLQMTNSWKCKKLVNLLVAFRCYFMLLTYSVMWLQDSWITSCRDFHCKRHHYIFTHFYWEMFVPAYFVIQMVPMITLCKLYPLRHCVSNKAWFLQYVTSEDWGPSKIFAKYKQSNWYQAWLVSKVLGKSGMVTNYWGTQL